MQISFNDKGITAQKAGRARSRLLARRQRGRVVRGHAQSRLDPQKDVKVSQQGFDMEQMQKGEIDAAQAMIYNESAQVLESKTRPPARSTRPTTSTSS